MTMWRLSRRSFGPAQQLCRGAASAPTIPPCAFQPEPYKGRSFEQAMGIRKENLSPAFVTYYKDPVMIHQGHMQYLYDINGKRYLDMFAGIVTVGVGHCHPKVTKAMKDQADRLWHTTNIYLNEPIHEYAEKLTALLPGDLKVCYFTNSGSEANDVAMMMARLYTRSHDIISLRNGFHGASPHVMPATNLGSWKIDPLMHMGVHATVNPDVYRGPWGGSHCRDSPVQADRTCSCAPDECQAADKYADSLQDLLVHCTPKQVAGMIIEPIQGFGGTVQYPKGFVQKAQKLIKARRGLIIADEVQTGFGRLGSHFWGFQTHGIVPDIVTMAKSIANGFPMGAVVTTHEIASVYKHFITFNTYSGNPMACKAASAVLDVIEEEKLQQNCAELGNHMLPRLAKLRDRFEVVGDVRGKGLMIGVELVADKATKTPLSPENVRLIWEDCKDMGVLFGKGGNYGTVLRLKPPMCVTKADCDFAVDVLEAALVNYENRAK